MRRSKISNILILLIMLIPVHIYSAFDYLTSGSARPAGLGMAYTGLAEGGENGFLNPAGLGFLKDRINFSTLYSPIFSGLNDGTLYNASFNIASSYNGIGGFAVNGQYLGAGIRSLDNVYREYSGILSYGRKINDTIAAGLNIKYYSWNSSSNPDHSGYRENYDISTLSFDIGGLYRAGNQTALGIMLADFTQPVISSDKAEEEYEETLPVKMRLGMTFGVEKVLVALESEAVERRLNFKTGAERYFYKEILAVRLGFQFWNMVRGININTGLGFNYKKWLLIDYAFQYPVTGIHSTTGTHRISMTFKK